MNYTISHILSHSLMNKASVLTGQNVLETHLVESISVIEIPVQHFVRKNEFVLTTAIGCQDNQIFLSFVKDICDSGASALAIAIGGHIHRIPRVVHAFAVENNFPLITLPWEIRFSDVIKVVVSGIHQWEQISQHNVDSLQREILRTFLNGQSIRKALKEMENVFRIKICLWRETGDEMIVPSDRQEEEYSIDLKLLNELHIIRISEIKFFKTTNNGTMQIFPFQTMSGKKAALIMKSASQAVLPVSKNILDQAVTPLHLWFRIDQQSRNFQEEKAKFFCKLIEGKWRSSEEIDRWASRYGLTASLKYALVTGMPETDLDHSQQYLVKNRVEDIIRICSSKIGVKYFCTFHDELLIIILEMKENIQKNISRLLDLLDQRLMDAEFPVHFWGIDDHLSEVLKIPALYQRAKTALEIGLTHKRLGRRITYSDTAVYRLLDAFAKNETANELIQNTLGNLTAYQQEHHLDLLRTLKCYINCKGNVSQTARTLSLQRQSLMYRLQKIESLSCRSLSNPDDLFIFQLSVKLMDV